MHDRCGRRLAQGSCGGSEPVRCTFRDLAVDAERSMLKIATLGAGVVLLRPLTAEYGPALAASYAELSTRSRYLRYHCARPARLDAPELAQLLEVDQCDRAAWVVEENGKGIALGRYVRTRPDAAEVALAVLDPWQGRGLSKLLLAALMRTARSAGIDRFVGASLPENMAALHLLSSIGGTALPYQNGEQWFELSTDIAYLPPTSAGDAIRYYDRLLTRPPR